MTNKLEKEYLALGFTPSAIKILERANSYSQAKGLEFVGTESILVGIMRCDSGAKILLEKNGVSRQKIEAQVASLIKGSHP